MRRLTIGLLLVGTAAISVPASAGAIPIHQHHKRVIYRMDADGSKIAVDVIRWKVKVDVAPPYVPPVVEAEPVATPSIDPGGIAPAPSSSVAAPSSGLTAPVDPNCESGGDPTTNTGNGYYGAYQFDSGTWDAYGDPAYGEASEAPMDVQTAAANSVPYDAWPNC